MLKSKTSQWSALTAMLCVGLLAATWFFLISPRRDAAAQVRDDAESTQQRNDQLQITVDQLKAQSADLPKRRTELARIYTQMPATSSMPELVTAISAMADQAGVRLESLSPGDAELLTASTGAAATDAAAAAAAAAQSGVTTDGEASAAPTDTTGTAATANDLGVRVVQQPVTITITGKYFQDVLFIKKLQSELKRVLLISALDIQTSSDTTSKDAVTMVISGKVFNLPDATKDDVATGDGSDGGATSGATSGASNATPSTQGGNALPQMGSRAGISAQGSVEGS